MKIGYFADGLWAHLALERLISEPNLEIAFIVPRYDSQDPVLRQYAERLNIPFIVHSNVNSPEFIQVVKVYEADIFVSMSFNQILKRQIIDLPPKGFINCHAGALPFYRGRNILNWALINGESKFGVTIHYIDECIDTGDIIVQEFGEIAVTDNYETILSKAVTLCAATLLKAIQAIANDGAERVPQSTINKVGFYCGIRREGDEWIDWQWTSKRIHDFIRGISLPGPCARTHHEGKIIAVTSAEWNSCAPNYLGTPGEVVGRNSHGIVIKTGDSTLLITRIADVSAENDVINQRTPTFRIGTRFGLRITQVIGDFQHRISQLEEEVQELRFLINGTKDKS